MSTRVKVVIAAVLVVLPVAGRWLWFNRGFYTPPSLAELDDSRIAVPLPEYSPLAEEVARHPGRVLFDLSHANNLEVDDLTPLQERLTARGVSSQTYDGFTTYLETELQGAVALVVAAPTIRFTEGEISAILDFVDDGGRVLLVADPTRQVPIPEEDILDLADILLPESAVPAINSLANALGVVYFDDYLYNLVENEANYRNVRLSVDDSDHPLTEGLETVTLFAAHSVQGDGPPILVGDENTHSQLRTGAKNLAGAVVAAEGRVLALGDLTLFTCLLYTSDAADE